MVTTHVNFMSPTNKRLGLRRTAVELFCTQMAYMRWLCAKISRCRQPLQQRAQLRRAFAADRAPCRREQEPASPVVFTKKSRRTICDFFSKGRKRFCGTRKAKGVSSRRTMSVASMERCANRRISTAFGAPLVSRENFNNWATGLLAQLTFA